ncbi:PREDICTED: DNA repair protein RAD50-like, partial [Priapulus caudatus]|uniref:DNA repair protein RAD50-like n=1 Tax=Priapulus caudatus TaxID=37621 RepID=A0ABM1EI47_PRICU
LERSVSPDADGTVPRGLHRRQYDRDGHQRPGEILQGTGRAVNHYHRKKMDEVNKTIKELWMRTYKGRDIEHIEIRSSEDEDGAGIEKSRRTYNYRVIMWRNGVALDMRGRCSAGQKVRVMSFHRVYSCVHGVCYFDGHHGSGWHVSSKYKS